jgi:hypothetical protein
MKSTIEVALNEMLTLAVEGDVAARFRRGEFRRRAVFVGAADEENIRAGLSSESGVDIRGEQRARQIPEVLDAIYVG